jgi:cytochrome c5
MKQIQYVLASLFIILGAFEGYSQEWTVPESEATVINPLPFNNATVREGKAVFEKNCKSCHGDPGKNNAIVLVPPPPDMASEIMQANTDGGMFYKVTNGRGAMPTFKPTLSETQIWQVINFIRKFDPRNAGKLIETALLKGKLTAAINKDSTALDIVAEVQNSPGIFSKLTNTSVFVQVKKAFGNLDIGKAVTNADGRAKFEIPKEIAGNVDGKADFVVTLGDDFEKTTAEVTNIKVAAPLGENPLTSRSVLWSTNDRTQNWLLFSYFLITGLVWISLLYIIFQISRIPKAGK